MQRNVTIKILITIIITIAIIMITSYTLASVTPEQITGENSSLSLDLDFIDELTEAIRIIGIFIAAGALMVIGIKYVTGSIEEKANYKKSMMPYIIGCVILFGASAIAPQIKDLFTDLGTDTEDIGNKIIGIIQVIGTIATVAVLMILGIKYMIGSTEERASYKRTMIPYLVGVMLIFGAINLTAMLYNVIPLSLSETAQESYSKGVSAAEEYISSVGGDTSKIEEHIQYVEDNYSSWSAAQGDGAYYYEAYLEELEEYLNSNN